MNPTEKAFFAGFAALALATQGLHYLMIFRVNRGLPPEERFLYSHTTGQWDRLKSAYKGFYPRSRLYELTFTCAVTLLVFSVATAGFFVWEFIKGK